MDNADFDELAGQLAAMARAVVALAHMMELETDMDGLTLSRRWRESVGPQADTALLRTARKTLHQLADSLDGARNRHQELQHQARLADPKLMQAHLDRRAPVGHRHLDALAVRLTHTESRLEQLASKAPPRPRPPKANA